MRAAGDDDAVLDVRAELLVARLLLADRRIEVGFETSGSGRGGPDFSVTVRGGRACNLEVTRPRRVPDRGALAELILAKLRQLPPGAPNALLVAIGGEAASALDVAGAVHLLRARADARDEAWLGTHHLADPRAFYARFLRLGGVYALAEAAAEARRGRPTGRTPRLGSPCRFRRPAGS